MKQTTCQNCGADEFIIKDGFKICKYCNSKYELTPDEKPTKTATVSLNSDVERLLEKCRKDPKKASRYAGLILDIDPTNKEALKYL